jgi:beta-glucosidase
MMTRRGEDGREDRRTASSRVQEWMSKMTLADKIGQMSQIDISLLFQDGGTQEISNEKLVHFFGELGIGSLLNMADRWDAKQYRQVMIRIQDIAKNHSRPPVIWGLDSVHGANYVHNAIATPQPINLAATFNVTMSHRAGQMASRDTRAAGITWLFSPILGLALEPKWSRVYETFGEDPKLVTEMGHHMISGIQEPDVGTLPSRAAACAKHFIGYSKPHNGHDRSPSWIPTRHLYQYFVPPWRAALKDALTVMESYSEYDGVPNVANRNSLFQLLRQRLGFDGVLVTDYSEILNLHKWHHIAASDEEATIYSLQEGSVDMSMIPLEEDGFRSAVEAGIKRNSLSMARIDQSVNRVLRLKEQLGMMDERLTMDDVNIDKVGNDQDREEALEMARQSIVLAENRDNILPLDPKEKIKVHITGPTASSLRYQSGGWTCQWQGPSTDEDWFTYGATVVDAAKATAWDISYSCGVDIVGNECTDSSAEVNVSPGILSKIEDLVGIGHGAEMTSILQSASMAASADYVVVCVGEENYTEKPGDIRSLELPQGQLELVKALSETTNSKIILVYFGGRPRLLRQMVVSTPHSRIQLSRYCFLGQNYSLYSRFHLSGCCGCCSYWLFART